MNIPNGTVFREYNGVTNEFLTRGMHYFVVKNFIPEINRYEVLEVFGEDKDKQTLPLSYIQARKDPAILVNKDLVDRLCKNPVPELNIRGNDTVTIYIDMHSSMDMTPLQSMPTHTVFGSSIGLCQFSNRENPLVGLNRLKQLYQTHRIHEANAMYNFSPQVNPAFPLSIQTILPLYKKVLQEAYPEESWDEIEQKYITQSKNTNFLRVYKTDKTYSIENDELTNRQGLYVIHTTNAYLQSALVRMSNVPIESYAVSILESSIPALNKHEFESLQQQNLNNVHVASIIHSDGMTLKTGAPVPSNANYTGINHYTKLNLSTILDFFGRIGIKHVNIIDYGCRFFMKAPPPPELQRQMSQEELKHGVIMSNLLKDYPMDGGKTKRKKKRNYKSKKNKR